jgi:hypothetical protein
MLATFSGTPFHLSINLFSIYFLIVSGIMLRSNVFGRVTAYMGILAAIFNWALYIPDDRSLPLDPFRFPFLDYMEERPRCPKALPVG